MAGLGAEPARFEVAAPATGDVTGTEGEEEIGGVTVRLRGEDRVAGSRRIERGRGTDLETARCANACCAAGEAERIARFMVTRAAGVNPKAATCRRFRTDMEPAAAFDRSIPIA